MTRIPRRTLERSLRAPAPAPDAELGRRIKSQIPADLLAARTDPSPAQPDVISSPAEPAATPVIAAAATGSRRRASRRGPALALAASVVVAIGAGYLASRLFREPAELSPSEGVVARAENEMAADPPLDRLSALDDAARAAPESRKEAPSALGNAAPAPNGLQAAGELRGQEAAHRQNEPVPEPQAKIELDREVAALAPSEPADRQLNEEIAPKESSRRALEERDLEPVAAPAAPAAAPAPVEAPEREAKDVPAASSPRPALQLARKADAQTESAPAADAASPAVAAGASFAGGSDLYADAMRQPISTVTAASGRGARDDVGEHGNRDSFADAAAQLEDPLRITRGELLAAAAGAEGRGGTVRSAMAIEGAAARTPGHVLLLVSASIEAGDASEARPTGERDAEHAADGAIELALDPSLVRRYRLLASHVDEAAAPRRIVALYELELGRAADASSVLATVRVRPPGGAADRDRSAARTIGAADFVSPWAEAPAALRLAALGAEIALLPPDSAVESVAPLRRELERVRADSRLDPRAARSAAGLLELALRAGAPEGTAVPAPAALKARNQG